MVSLLGPEDAMLPVRVEDQHEEYIHLGESLGIKRLDFLLRSGYCLCKYQT